jgi:hypothetical protein
MLLGLPTWTHLPFTSSCSCSSLVAAAACTTVRGSSSRWGGAEIGWLGQRDGRGMMIASATRQHVDDLWRVRECACSGRWGCTMTAMWWEGDPHSPHSWTMPVELCPLIVDRAERWIDWSGAWSYDRSNRLIWDVDRIQWCFAKVDIEQYETIQWC